MLITISSGPGTPRTVLGEMTRNGSAMASCAAATATATFPEDAIGRRCMAVVEHTPAGTDVRGAAVRLCCAVVDVRRLSPHRRGQLAVALAAVAWSTAGLFQRELTMNTITQLGGRALFAMLALLAYVAVAERGAVIQAFRSIGLPGIAVAVCMATASGCFIIALNHTTVAHVLFIQAISPVLAALLAWVALREPITPRIWLAMLTALVGVGVMIGSPSDTDLAGDGVSLLMSLSFAVA